MFVKKSKGTAVRLRPILPCFVFLRFLLRRKITEKISNLGSDAVFMTFIVVFPTTRTAPIFARFFFAAGPATNPATNPAAGFCPQLRPSIAFLFAIFILSIVPMLFIFTFFTHGSLRKEIADDLLKG